MGTLNRQQCSLALMVAVCLLLVTGSLSAQSGDAISGRVVDAHGPVAASAAQP